MASLLLAAVASGGTRDTACRARSPRHPRGSGWRTLGRRGRRRGAGRGGSRAGNPREAARVRWRCPLSIPRLSVYVLWPSPREDYLLPLDTKPRILNGALQNVGAFAGKFERHIGVGLAGGEY